jgi:hypothetical protein
MTIRRRTMGVPSPATCLVTYIEDPDTPNRLDKIFELFTVEWCCGLRPNTDLARAGHQTTQDHGIASISEFVVQRTVAYGLAGHVSVDEGLHDCDCSLDCEFSVPFDCI